MLNYLIGDVQDIEKIEIGMGATMIFHSDRSPATVISKTAKTVTIQSDNAVRIDKNGMSETQEYEYSRNPKGSIHVVRKTKRRGWATPSFKVVFGHREEYYDFSF